MAISKNDLLKSLMKDFETSATQSDYSLKKQCDRLAAYAHVAIEALEEDGRADFVFLKHDGMRDWWINRKEAIRKQEEVILARQRKAELKLSALAKLTDEERKALGIK